MKHRRADQVKMCNIVPERPGILKPFMTPTKLRNQVRAGGKVSDLQFSPAGKTLTGGVQWTIKTQRPGIAESLITAKSEQKALAKGIAMEAKIAAKGKAKAKAKAQAAMIAEEVEKAAAEDPTANGGMSGYGYSW
jgi:hypothetical protein